MPPVADTPPVLVAPPVPPLEVDPPEPELPEVPPVPSVLGDPVPEEAHPPSNKAIAHDVTREAARAPNRLPLAFMMDGFIDDSWIR